MYICTSIGFSLSSDYSAIATGGGAKGMEYGDMEMTLPYLAQNDGGRSSLSSSSEGTEKHSFFFKFIEHFSKTNNKLQIIESRLYLHTKTKKKYTPANY